MLNCLAIRFRFLLLLSFCVALFSVAPHAAWAGSGVSVSASGTPTYGIPIRLPPGIAGMTPNLGISYTGGGVNGPVGYGWTIQGISTITRCPGTVATDGLIIGVAYTPHDKLCLDGQRLIETNAAGSPVAASPAANGASNAAVGFTNTTSYIEFRTEKDTYARIRGYGAAGGNTSAGPSYFLVWTKSGQIYEYGAGGPSGVTNANSLIAAQGTSVPMAWAVTRISDTVGNYIDFKYVQRDTNWGTGFGSPASQPGREWNLMEVQYTGHGTTQTPLNKVVFDYEDRLVSSVGTQQDRAEAYQMGSKNVSIWRLRAVRTYTNWGPSPLGFTAQGTSFPAASTSDSAGAAIAPATSVGAVEVSALKIAYTNSPTTGRSLVSSLTDCAGANENECQPATTFQYTLGENLAFVNNATFASSGLASLKMIDATSGAYGVMLGDFNADGKTDILRWGNTPSDNQLWTSNGDGSFTQVPAGTSAGQFNLNTQKLFSNDGCYSSITADFTGDGIADVLRIVQPTRNGLTCTTSPGNALFIGNGDGSFKAPVTVSGIDFTSVAEKITTTLNMPCNNASVVGAPLLSGNSTGQPSGAAPMSIVNGCTDVAKSVGQSFQLLDVNGDGILDIVTSISPTYQYSYSDVPPAVPTPDSLCASTVCTHVYLGSTSGNGTFTELTTTSLAHHSVYTDPPSTGMYAAYVRPGTLDFDGDGLTDLFAKYGSWRSLGNGNFSQIDSTALAYGCSNPLDFNGDGRVDCMIPESYANSTSSSNQGLAVMTGSAEMYVTAFNLTATGQDLGGINASGQVDIGTLIGDFDGDGRSDILRWENDPTLNVLYLSNGDGTFRTAASGFNLNTPNRGLGNSDGKTAFQSGDFTGHGNVEILRMKDSPVAGSEATSNELYVRTSIVPPPDLLQNVTSPTGLKTALTYVPLTNSVSGTLGKRYTAGAAVGYPKVNVIAPMYVVATVKSDTGIGSDTVNTEYAYQGLRAHLLGRGLLGFARTLQASPAPDGSELTVVTDYLQDQPYIGVASVSQTAPGNVTGSLGANISRTTNAYCDTTSASAAGTITSGGTAPAACATTALVQRPYLSQTLEEGWDLDANALPSVTTTNTFNTSGDPSTIAVKTTATVASVAQTFTKTTTNTYNPDVTSCASVQTCSWILGRLNKSVVASSVPNSIGSFATSAGTGANASATHGTGIAPPPTPPAPPPPISPATLSAILSLLLSD